MTSPAPKELTRSEQWVHLGGATAVCLLLEASLPRALEWAMPEWPVSTFVAVIAAMVSVAAFAVSLALPLRAMHPLLSGCGLVTRALLVIGLTLYLFVTGGITLLLLAGCWQSRLGAWW